MSPTNLGDLSATAPVPTGLCQIKRGVTGGETNYNNTIASGTPFRDVPGGGNPIAISITPSRPGWWIIRAECIMRCSDAAWTYHTWYVGCSPADADGKTADWMHCSMNSAQVWQESCLNTAFRLNAGTAYTATMFWGYSSGYNQVLWNGGDYLYIMGEFVGEGRV